MAFLVAAGAFIAAVVVGAVLLSLGHTLIGIVIALSAIPVALVAWVMWGDRL